MEPMIICQELVYNFHPVSVNVAMESFQFCIVHICHVHYFLFAFFHSQKELFFLECDVGQTEFTPPAMISLNRVCSPLLGRLQTFCWYFLMANLYLEYGR